MKCPICKEGGFTSNDGLTEHFSKKHYTPDIKKIIISFLIIILFISFSIIINTIAESGDSYANEKRVGIWFRESTSISNIHFYYNQDKGQLNFSFYDFGNNLSQFHIYLPDKLKIENFSVKDDGGLQMNDLIYHEYSGYSLEENSKGYTFQRIGADNWIPTKSQFYMSINFSGELEPAGNFMFYTVSDKEKSVAYDIELIFKDRKCLGNCITILGGPYTQFSQTQNKNILIIKSEKNQLDGDTADAIQMTLNTEDTSLKFRDVWNIFILPMVSGFIITIIFYIRW